MTHPAPSGGPLRHAVRVALVVAVSLNGGRRVWQSINAAAGDLLEQIAAELGLDTVGRSTVRRAIAHTTLAPERALAMTVGSKIGGPTEQGNEQGSEQGNEQGAAPDLEQPPETGSPTASPQVEPQVSPLDTPAATDPDAGAYTSPPPAPPPPPAAGRPDPVERELVELRDAAALDSLEPDRRRARALAPAPNPPHRQRHRRNDTATSCAYCPAQVPADAGAVVMVDVWPDEVDLDDRDMFDHRGRPLRRSVVVCDSRDCLAAAEADALRPWQARRDAAAELAALVALVAGPDRPSLFDAPARQDQHR